MNKRSKLLCLSGALDTICGYEELLRRVAKSLNWMITDIQTRFDATGINPGNYSDELRKAMQLREYIKQILAE